MRTRLLLTLVALTLAGSSCGQPTTSATPVPTEASRITQPAVSSVPTSTAVPAPTPTAHPRTAAPAATPRPTETTPSEPTQTVTATPVDSPETTPDKTIQSAFDDFLEQAHLQQITRDPELISELGLAQALGMDNSRLTDVSDAFQRETYALLQSQLDQLNSFDRTALTPEQQLSYDLFGWDLRERLAGQEFRFYDYPVNQLFGLQNSFIELMTDRHPLTNLQDAQDYVSRLQAFETKIDQAVEWLKLQEAAGITPPEIIVQRVLGQLRGYASQTAERTALYQAFTAGLSTLDSLGDAEKGQLAQDTATAIEQNVIPAYQTLQAYFEHLEQIADTDVGFWKHPNGQAAYNYWLRHHTTTELTADEIHALGLQEVSRIQAEMEALFSQLGIDGNSLGDKMDQVAVQSEFVNSGDLSDAYQALIEQADQNLTDLFDIRPQADVVVVAVNQPSGAGAYYVGPAVDGSRPGTFYVNLAAGSFPRFAMPTLAYHEAIPGHHFQIAIQQELTNLPSFRQGSHFTAYVEGWALYAEYLAWEAGFYDDDPYGNLGRLQSELFRAARLVVDTGIHAQGWTREQAIDYMVQNVGYSQGRATAEVERYIAWPGQATSYQIGMLKILELRQQAEQALGEAFDIKQFHNVILKNGAMPLEILERVVDAYIQENQR